MISMKNPHYGGFWIRFLASMLDSIIIGIPTVILQLLLFFWTGEQTLMYLIQLAVLAIIVYLDGIKGGTPGKMILKMRIVNAKGDYIGIPNAFLRYLGKIISALIIGIGFLMIAWNPKKQGLHDKVAQTYVVRI